MSKNVIFLVISLIVTLFFPLAFIAPIYFAIKCFKEFQMKEDTSNWASRIPNAKYSHYYKNSGVAIDLDHKKVYLKEGETKRFTISRKLKNGDTVFNQVGTPILEGIWWGIIWL